MPSAIANLLHWPRLRRLDEPIWPLLGCIRGITLQCLKVVFPLIAQRNCPMHRNARAASWTARPKSCATTCQRIAARLHPCSAPIFGPCHMVLSNYSHAIPQARKARLPPKIYWKQGSVCTCADWVCCHQMDRESPNGL